LVRTRAEGFAEASIRLIIVEEKASSSRRQVKAALYGLPERRLSGASTARRRLLLPAIGYHARGGSLRRVGDLLARLTGTRAWRKRAGAARKTSLRCKENSPRRDVAQTLFLLGMPAQPLHVVPEEPRAGRNRLPRSAAYNRPFTGSFPKWHGRGESTSMARLPHRYEKTHLCQ